MGKGAPSWSPSGAHRESPVRHRGLRGRQRGRFRHLWSDLLCLSLILVVSDSFCSLQRVLLPTESSLPAPHATSASSSAPSVTPVFLGGGLFAPAVAADVVADPLKEGAGDAARRPSSDAFPLSEPGGSLAVDARFISQEGTSSHVNAGGLSGERKNHGSGSSALSRLRDPGGRPLEEGEEWLQKTERNAHARSTYPNHSLYSVPEGGPDDSEVKDRPEGDRHGLFPSVSGSRGGSKENQRFYHVTTSTGDGTPPPPEAVTGASASSSPPPSSCPSFASSVLSSSPPVGQPTSFRLWLTQSLDLDPSVVGLSLPAAVLPGSPSGHLASASGQSAMNGRQQTGADSLEHATSSSPGGYLGAHSRGTLQSASPTVGALMRSSEGGGDVQPGDALSSVADVVGGAGMGVGDDWSPDAQTAAIGKVGNALERQVSKITADADWLQKQLAGIDDDLQLYRSALLELRPQKSADAVEKFVVGGPQFPLRVLMEKLQQGVRALDSRIETFARTNSTLFESQLEAVLEQQLTPIRRDVLELSLALASASDTALDVTRELAELPRRADSAVSRYKKDIAALRGRLEELFGETMQHEDLRLRGRLEELKQKEQSRINELNLEEQILSTAVEDAIQDMERRGFGVLDASSVYPASDAKKVLDLLLYLVDKKRKRNWDVLPIVVVTAPLPPRPVSQADMKEMSRALAEANMADTAFAGRDGGAPVEPGGPLSSEPAPPSEDTLSRKDLSSASQGLATAGTEQRRGEEEAGERRAADEPLAEKEHVLAGLTTQSKHADANDTWHEQAGGGVQAGSEDAGAETVPGGAGADGGGVSSGSAQQESLRQTKHADTGGHVERQRKDASSGSAQTETSEAFFFGESTGSHHETSGGSQGRDDGLPERGGAGARSTDSYVSGLERKFLDTPVGVEWGCQGCAEEMDSMSAELDAWLGRGHFLPAKVVQRARSEKPKQSIIPPLFTLQHLVLEHFRAFPMLVPAPLRRQSSSATTEETRELPLSLRGTAEAFEQEIDGRDAGDGVRGRDSVEAKERQAEGQANTEEGATSKEGTTKGKGTTSAGFSTSESKGYYVLRVDKLLVESFFVASTGEVTPVPTRYPSSPAARALGPLVPHSAYGAQFARAFASLRPSSSSAAPVPGASTSLEPSYYSAAVSEGRKAGATKAVRRPGDAIGLFRRKTPTSSRVVAQPRQVQKVEPGNAQKSEDGLAVLARVQQEIAKSRQLDGSRVVRFDSKNTYATFDPFECCVNTVPEGGGALSARCAHVAKIHGSFQIAGQTHDKAEPSVGESGGSSEKQATKGGAADKPKTTGVGGESGRPGARAESSQEGGEAASGSSPSSAAGLSLPGGESTVLQTSPRLPPSPSSALRGSPPRRRKVLLAYLGSRTSGLPLRYLGGKGRELRRQQLTRNMVEDLVTHHLNAICHLGAESSSRAATDTPSRGLNCGTLQAFRKVGLEVPVWRQLMALKQELYVSAPAQWGDVIFEKTMESHQIELFTVSAKAAPPLFLPLTPFFQNNVFIIRVQVASCSSRGPPKFAVPPASVLERSLYLVGFPAAGLAAVAGFYYAEKAQSRLERLKEKARAKAAEAFPRLQAPISAMQSANLEAGLWGRTSGAAEESNWIAHVTVKAGQNASSLIELVDGQASLPRRRTKEPQWWREESPDLMSGKVNYGSNAARVFVKGRTAGEGEAAKECESLEEVVRRVGAVMETRVIPSLYASEMRGKRVLVVLSTDQHPFEGERLFNGAAMQRGWEEAGLLPKEDYDAQLQSFSREGKPSPAKGAQGHATKTTEESMRAITRETSAHADEKKKKNATEEQTKGKEK